MLFVQWTGAFDVPTLQLAGFDKIAVKAGESTSASITLQPRHYAVLTGAATDRSTFLDDAYSFNHDPAFPTWSIEAQTVRVYVGGQQPNQTATGTSNVLESSFDISGPSTALAGCAGGEPS